MKGTNVMRVIHGGMSVMVVYAGKDIGKILGVFT